MSSKGSVSALIQTVRAGDPAAMQDLWKRYGERLERLARKKLGNLPGRIANEEDIANRAYESLCLGARAGRFPDVNDRESLWRILCYITMQKVADQIAYEKAEKRGGGKVRGESVFEFMDGDKSQRGIQQVMARGPGPLTINQWAEEYRRLLNMLPNDTLRRIAELRVQGYTIDEITELLGLSKSSIRRKLDIVREKWAREVR